MISMSPASRPAKAASILLIVAVIVAVILGVSTGVALAATSNTRNSENFSSPKLNLPSRIFDIKGRLITEFFSDEKRENEKYKINVGDELPPGIEELAKVYIAQKRKIQGC